MQYPLLLLKANLVRQTPQTLLLSVAAFDPALAHADGRLPSSDLPLPAHYAPLPGATRSTLLFDGTVTGRVVDGKGVGIPGVTVLVEGTTLGASTKTDGTYLLTHINRLSIGVRDDQTTQVASTTLTENTTQLSEVVGVGYGMARRLEVIR